MEKIKAIIDMDIGDDIDDAFELQYAINHPDFEILGVTVMYKNCYQRAKMARPLLEKNGITNVGVYMGYDKPLVEEIKPFWYESIGKDGKANLLSWDESLEKYPVEERHAVDFMIETAKKYPSEVTLFGIGPMTNIAKAIEKAPDEMKKLKEIILMSGNRDMILEYNLMVDPEAAKIVYDSEIPVTLVGGNVTLKCNFFQRHLKRELEMKGEAFDFLNEMMMKWISYNMRPPVMHDALTLSVAAHDYVKFTPLSVEVQTENGKRGKISVTEPIEGKKVFPASLSVDNAGFLDHFFEIMEKTGKKE